MLVLTENSVVLFARKIIQYASTVGVFPPFRSWLDDNEASAVKKLKTSLPLRKELERLKFELSHQLQLSDIR